MGIINDMGKLDTRFQPIAEWIIMHAFMEYDTKLIVNETLRQDNVQQAYYAQGRQPLEQVNELRKSAGLYLIDANDNQSIITNMPHVATDHGHGAGLAMDVVPDGNWDAQESKWQVIGSCVDDANKNFQEILTKDNAKIFWGNNWTGLHDKPHVEMVITTPGT